MSARPIKHFDRFIVMESQVPEASRTGFKIHVPLTSCWSLWFIRRGRMAITAARSWGRGEGVGTQRERARGAWARAGPPFPAAPRRPRPQRRPASAGRRPLRGSVSTRPLRGHVAGLLPRPCSVDLLLRLRQKSVRQLRVALFPEARSVPLTSVSLSQHDTVVTTGG